MLIMGQATNITMWYILSHVIITSYEVGIVFLPQNWFIEALTPNTSEHDFFSFLRKDLQSDDEGKRGH